MRSKANCSQHGKYSLNLTIFAHQILKKKTHPDSRPTLDEDFVRDRLEEYKKNSLGEKSFRKASERSLV